MKSSIEINNDNKQHRQENIAASAEPRCYEKTVSLVYVGGSRKTGAKTPTGKVYVPAAWIRGTVAVFAPWNAGEKPPMPRRKTDPVFEVVGDGTQVKFLKRVSLHTAGKYGCCGEVSIPARWAGQNIFVTLASAPAADRPVSANGRGNQEAA